MVADGQGGFFLTPAEMLFPAPVSASPGLPSHFPGALMEGFHLKEEEKNQGRKKKTGADGRFVQGRACFCFGGFSRRAGGRATGLP